MKRPDLNLAVSAMHARPQPPQEDPVDPTELELIPDHLLLGAGDAPERTSFFEHDDGSPELHHHGRQVNLLLGAKASLPDYRTREGRRTHRSMITIPPKLRQAVRELVGAASDSDIRMTTAIVALADYAAMALKRDGKCLLVSPAIDPQPDARKAARKLVRRNRSITR